MTKTSDLSDLFDIDRLVAEQRRRESVQCPACGYTFDAEDMAGLVSYWGDNGPREMDCPECERAMVVTENVERTYEVQAKVAEAEEGDDGT
ncbi:hypothetical protein LCGC14_0839550 [marine sediment metagenome]|uniref:Uncharacterized protein n=1 Tax=marine sediment metagenome TaxID=412755 RepID=A0A0F9PYR2_9ZZZZ